VLFAIPALPCALPWAYCSAATGFSLCSSEASDKVLSEKRKTITGDDVLWAMSTLGFEKYVEPLKVYLSRYRESVKQELVPHGTSEAK
jgi:nuclear transcription Y subunit beta